MDIRGIGQEHKIIYVALGKTTGLTDLLLQPYDELGAAFGSPIAFTELVNGAYEASFTPDAEGIWRVRVSSVSNLDDAIKTIEVVAVELDMVAEAVDEVKTVVDAIKIETDKIQVVDDNVDAVKVVVDATAAKVDIIKAKTDNLPADTAQELTDIDSGIAQVQTDIDIIKTGIKTGGYFA